MNKKNVKIFSGNATPNLAQKIAENYGQALGNLSIKRFNDGEIFPIFQESIRGIQTFIIQSTFAPSDNIMELLLIVDAAKRASAKSITVVIPYFGYARQDRKDRPRVAIAAKLIANLMEAAGIDRLITLDLHSKQIQGFFNCPVDHLENTSIFIPYIKKLNLKNLIFAAPDLGSVTTARTYAQYFDVPIVICDKYREEANKIKSMQLIGNVQGANVILIDDIIDTGGTICKAAELLKNKGANSIRTCCTHPVFSQNAIQKLEHAAFDEVIVTDTIPLKIHSHKIKILSVASIFAQTIQNISNQKSIHLLYDY